MSSYLAIAALAIVRGATPDTAAQASERVSASEMGLTTTAAINPEPGTQS